jgi:hypothetical protein
MQNEHHEILQNGDKMWQSYFPELIHNWKDGKEDEVIEQVFWQLNSDFAIFCVDLFCSIGSSDVLETLKTKIVAKENEAGISINDEVNLEIDLYEESFSFFQTPTKSTIISLTEKILQTFDYPISVLKLGILAGSLANSSNGGENGW